MWKPTSLLILAQVFTLSRVGASLAFAMTAFQVHLRLWALGFFLYALIGDVFDGRFARHFNVTSSVGATLDGFGDKFQTIVSVLYLAALGYSPLACALLVLRDLLTASLRSIRVDDVPLIPPKRWVGGLSGTPIKILTATLVACPAFALIHRHVVEGFVWTFAILTSSVLLISIWKDRRRIWRAFNED
jgi:phosphatidylglycerophosphate synthase